MPHVTLYTTPTCGYCKMTKEFFKKHGVVYTEKDVTVDEVARDEVVKLSGQLGVPVSIIGEGEALEIIIGFDQPKLEHALGFSH